MNQREFESGQKVIFRGKTYDFGYYYEEGERNMQDSCAVRINELKLKRGQ